jgi:two-component system, NarL family, nitrate/nitrite response regulator NarL
MQPQEVLKQLIQELSISATSKDAENLELRSDRIICEVEIDGVRYYLLRRVSQLVESPQLSPREQAIANLVARGFSNKTIAKELEISPWTVATYLRRIFEKLNVNSRTAMIARLLEQKI